MKERLLLLNAITLRWTASFRKEKWLSGSKDIWQYYLKKFMLPIGFLTRGITVFTCIRCFYLSRYSSWNIGESADTSIRYQPNLSLYDHDMIFGHSWVAYTVKVVLFSASSLTVIALLRRYLRLQVAVVDSMPGKDAGHAHRHSQ